MYQALLRAVDMPAREALLLSRRSILITVAIAVSGALIVAAATTLAFALDPVKTVYSLSIERLDLLRALFEAVAVVVPSAIVFATYARIKVTPRAFFSGFALGMLVAGVVVASTLPLMAFLAIVARARPMLMLTPAFLLPAIAVASIAATLGRVVRTIDPSVRARVLIVVFNIGLFVTFGARVLVRMSTVGSGG